MEEKEQDKTTRVDEKIIYRMHQKVLRLINFFNVFFFFIQYVLYVV